MEWAQAWAWIGEQIGAFGVLRVVVGIVVILGSGGLFFSHRYKKDMKPKVSESQDNSFKLKGEVNPLAFKPVDLSGADGSTNKPTLEEVLEFLCPRGTPSDIESLIERYREIDRVPMQLAIVPSEPRILEKIVWPLRDAKAFYMVGNYLAVITLCGMVAEMVAILLWKLHSVKFNKKKEIGVFGQTFEKLRQGRRTKILLAYQQISEQTEALFDSIRTPRNSYLHSWSKARTPDAEQKDALKVFNATVSLVSIAIGAQGYKDGVVILPGKLVEYLKRQGGIS